MKKLLIKLLPTIALLSPAIAQAIDYHCSGSGEYSCRTVTKVAVNLAGSKWVSFSTAEDGQYGNYALNNNVDTDIGKAQLAMLMQAQSTGQKITFSCTSTWVGPISIDSSCH